MSKIKVNFKLLVAVFGLMLLAGLIPLGLQALATDEAAEPAAPAVDPAAPAVDPGCPNPTPAEPATEAEAALPAEPAAPAEPANATTFTVRDAEHVYTLNNEHEFTLEDGEEVVFQYDVDHDVIIDHVGYLYIKHTDGTKTCIAAAFNDSEFKKFLAWDEVASASGGFSYGPMFETYDPTTDGYFYQAGQMFDKESAVPIEGGEVS